MNAQLALFDAIVPDIPPSAKTPALRYDIIAEFRVDGEPKGQPRHRSFSYIDVKGKARARSYDPGTAENWKNQIAIFARKHLPSSPLLGPLRVDIVFHMPRPQRLMRKRDPEGPIPYDVKPDRDNADKAVLDAMKNLGFFRDDCQVFDGRILKFYHAKNEIPHAVIRISVLKEDIGQ